MTDEDSDERGLEMPEEDHARLGEGGGGGAEEEGRKRAEGAEHQDLGRRGGWRVVRCHELRGEVR